MDTGTQTEMLFSIVLSAVLIRPKKNLTFIPVRILTNYKNDKEKYTTSFFNNFFVTETK